MKTFFAIFLFTIEVCYAQLIPHTASITTTKDSIFADEVFNVTYSLMCPAGYIYIGLNDDYFEAIGKDRWEGEIKDDQTITVMFTVKIKERMKAGIQEKAPLSIGFSYHPFGERISAEYSKSILISITDLREMKEKINKMINGRTNKINDTNNINNNNLYPIPLDTNIPMLKKTIIGDTTFPRHEYLRGNKKTN